MTPPLAVRFLLGALVLAGLQGCTSSTTHKAPTPSPGGVTHRWTNSLGLPFVPVPGTQVLFCVWKTRVVDFEQFMEESHYQGARKLWSVMPADGYSGGWFAHEGGTWKTPGFPQSPTHPVCGVSWNDAVAFCAWLTEREQRAGLLSSSQRYRLPTDAEWSSAVGPSQYSWGDQWPPPAGAGNFAGEEVLADAWPTNRPPLRGYHDGFARTSPVGHFRPNQYGLYDLMGNLGEWCEDYFQTEMNSEMQRQEHPFLNLALPGDRVLRGASWNSATPFGLTCSKHGWAPPDYSTDTVGFRFVLTCGQVSLKPGDHLQGEFLVELRPPHKL